MVTFFSGKTFDGHRWVLSFEGCPAAVGGRPCWVHGRVGREVKVRFLSVAGGSELRALLPSLKLCEVREELRFCATLK